MGLKAGASVLDITPTTPCHLGGYASRDKPHESVNDPLSLRALYVTDGTDEALLVSADLLWFRGGIEDRIHDAIETQLGIPAARVMLVGTHTHSAPITNGPNANRGYLHFLEAQTLAAAAIAKDRATDVRVEVGRGESKVGVNRREQKPTGEVILGENPNGPIDREIVLMSLVGSSGPVAEVCSFATHGTVMGGENYALSGDWCGLAASALESKSDAAFLFMNGGAANVNPRGRTRPSQFAIAESLAEEFVKDIDSSRERMQSAEDGTIVGVFETLELPRKHRDVEEGMGRTRKVRIQGLRIGPAKILGFPGEVFSETSMAVKKALAPDVVMVNSYTTGGDAGYVPVAEAYDTGGYEVRVSPYSEEAESVLREGFVALGRQL